MIVPVGTAGGLVLGLASLGLAVAICLYTVWRIEGALRRVREAEAKYGPLLSRADSLLLQAQAAFTAPGKDGHPVPPSQMATNMLTVSLVNAAYTLMEDPEVLALAKKGLPSLGEGLARGYVQAQQEPVVEPRMANSHGGGGLPIRGIGKVVTKAISKEAGPLDGIIEQMAPYFIQRMMGGQGGNGGPAAGGAHSAPSGGGFPWQG